MSPLSPDDPNTRQFLRHALATLAYRAGKTVRGTPAAFGEYRVTPDSPRPLDTLAHMGDLMDWVLSKAQGKQRWRDSTPRSWEEEIERFFTALGALDAYLASGKPILWEPERLFQGGIADAFTHTGQLAMLRRLAGYKMKGENYSKAEIVVGRVGLAQTAPEERNEFD